MMQQYEMSATYNISDIFLKKTKKNYLYLMILIPLGMICAGLYFERSMGGVQIVFSGLFIGLILFLELEIAVIAKIMLSKIRKNQLIFSETQLQRIMGRKEEPIAFSDIRKMVIRKEKDSSVRFVNVETEKRKITLYGFENMDQIAAYLTAHAPGAERKEKQYRFNYDSPLAWVVIFGGTMALLLGILSYTGLPVSYLVCLALGVWLLFGKPVSRAQGQRFRIMELILGFLVTAGNLLLIAMWAFW